MLIPIITQYLALHRRLVIPQFGAFIVKTEGGEVVFSELLKRDDNVLRGLLRAQGESELEAAGEIDRFVFEVRHALEHGEEYRLDGFGLFRRGPNKTIVFVYDPAPKQQPEIAGAQNNTSNNSESDPATSSPQPKIEVASPVVERTYPDPVVSDLRYDEMDKSKNSKQRSRLATRRRGLDRFIWIAVLAALVAVGAIAYGYYREAQEKQSQLELLEQIAPPAEESPQSAPATESVPAADATPAEGAVSAAVAQLVTGYDVVAGNLLSIASAAETESVANAISTVAVPVAEELVTRVVVPAMAFVHLA